MVIIWIKATLSRIVDHQWLGQTFFCVSHEGRLTNLWCSMVGVLFNIFAFFFDFWNIKPLKASNYYSHDTKAIWWKMTLTKIVFVPIYNNSITILSSNTSRNTAECEWQNILHLLQQTFSALIGLKIEYPWIIHFSLILYSWINMINIKSLN